MVFVLVRYTVGATALASDLIFEKREAALAFAAARGMKDAVPLGMELWQGYHGSHRPTTKE